MPLPIREQLRVCVLRHYRFGQHLNRAPFACATAAITRLPAGAPYHGLFRVSPGARVPHSGVSLCRPPAFRGGCAQDGKTTARIVRKVLTGRPLHTMRPQLKPVLRGPNGLGASCGTLVSGNPSGSAVRPFSVRRVLLRGFLQARVLKLKRHRHSRGARTCTRRAGPRSGTPLLPPFCPGPATRTAGS